ncbi:hypothetical protein QQY66_19595 [Streptomyces sp. DG2A-72]|uniref:hypothetical protein n=1 Tax=Streptomyces sp. DG2A-72 TaxID=3051386 RepID=UPI00265B8499|nr:hypothetical protein [Streptomyces sp. DG2A-72]MDO0933781.1 hypothetical protein [Streptomyces sp. DG2A-72]
MGEAEFGGADLVEPAQGLAVEGDVDVGVPTLDYETFDVRSSPGLRLIVHHAPTDSPSADALNLLGSLVASRNRSTK